MEEEKKSKWEQVEVVGEDGVVRMEERIYKKNGSYLTKPEKGNKRGRKPGVVTKIPDLPILLAEILSQKDRNGVPAAMLILAGLRKRAIAGDIRAAELLFDRAYGKAKQEINVNKTERQFIVIAGKQIEF